MLAADRVSNSGAIRTPGGKNRRPAASERITLQLDNGGLMSVQVTGDVVNALVENRGLVGARDGQVYLTALGRGMLNEHGTERERGGGSQRYAPSGR
ncbi:hypothetical protein ACVXG9_13385 [Escherichia coli]